MTPGPELSDDAVTVGVTTAGEEVITVGLGVTTVGLCVTTVGLVVTTVGLGAPTVGVTLDPAVTGVGAVALTAEVPAGSPLPVGVPTPTLVGVTPRADAAGDGVVLLVERLLGADPETMVGVAAIVAGALMDVDVPDDTDPVTAVPPTSPLLITGVGAELIEELTVTSGFAVSDGGISCPVGG